MLTLAVVAAVADSSSALAVLLPPDMFNMAEVAAVSGCSKNLKFEKVVENYG